MGQSRREVIKTLTLAGAATAAGPLSSGCTSTADGNKLGSRPVRYGMVIDLKKCVGCHACVVACKAENHTPPGVVYNVVMEEEIGVYPNVRPRFLPRPCFQCKDSSCSKVCPTGATYVRDDGIVAVDYDTCIGCRYCISACPYGSRCYDFGENYDDPSTGLPTGPSFRANAKPTPYQGVPSPEYSQYRPRRPGKSPEGNVRKCSFCLHRIKNGMTPACVATCIGRAMYFGDLNDPESDVHMLGIEPNVNFPKFPNRAAMRLKEELGNNPSVFYLT